MKNAKLKVFIFGQHSRRIPFSYAAYRPFFTPFFEFTATPDDADFLVCGFFVDIRDNAEMLFSVMDTKPDTKLVVFSEEPLWDTLWYYQWQKPLHDVVVSVRGKQFKWPFHFINHVNSDLYNFVKIPYFLTTEDHYLARYNQLLRIELQKSPLEVLASWQQASKRFRFIAEKRLEPKYQKTNPDGSLLALSVYRTELALHIADQQQVACLGKGWQSEQRRQDIPDWHLDKITQLHGDRFIVSALENTTLANYLSEKIFDALAVGAVPVYWAEQEHRIKEFVPESLMLNVAGLSITAAAQLLSTFTPDIEYAQCFQQTQHDLLARFSNPYTLIEERRIFAAKTLLHFRKLLLSR